MKDSLNMKPSPRKKRSAFFNQQKIQEMAEDLTKSKKPKKEMPLLINGTYRFNGCGTALIGRRDFKPDGTFITTAWMTFLFVPIFPIQSLRISTSSESFSISKESFTIHQKYWLDFKQISLTYLFTAFLIGWLTVEYYFCDWLNYTAVALTIATIVLPIPFLFAVLLRRYAETKAFKES